jgi:hypothetical protein
MYVKPCFVTLNGLNTKRSRVKPCVQCIMWLVANLIRNWILVVIWLLISIFMVFRWIGVQFLFSIKTLLYKSTNFLLVLLPIQGFWNFTHINDLSTFMYSLEKAHLQRLQDHLIWRNFLHIIPLTFFFTNNSWCNLVVWLGIINNLKWKRHVSKWCECFH